jgi:acyl-coenzyme A thioesterase PaaI-like protein
MTVRFKRPARVGRKLILEGRVVGRNRRVISCESLLRDEEGVEIAAATGKLILVRSFPTAI